MNKKDLKIEVMRGTGPGGQHRNKTESACRITHIPTGISAYSDERSQKNSRRKAMAELESRLANVKKEKRAAAKKERRDYAIHNTETIRTYNYSRNEVKDHRTGKTDTIKNILQKARFTQLTEGL